MLFWITADAIGNTDDFVEKTTVFLNDEVLPDRTDFRKLYQWCKSYFLVAWQIWYNYR